MSDDAVLSEAPLEMRWPTLDPFLFCVHHDEKYPQGNEKMGPAASLSGRQIGQDFSGKDGWSMYHGDVVPGFPQHPHRGFETVTLVRRGFIDHTDSLGASSRFGQGDAQWLTAGKGIVHSEMFPLREQSAPNPVELFQIWLNLPGEDKLVEPHFSMLWNDQIPTHTAKDKAGRVTEVRMVAGTLAGVKAPPPPPKSWAARSDSDVAIWTIRLAPEARWTLPPAAKGTNRMVYFFRGSSLRVGARTLSPKVGVALRPEVAVELDNGSRESELLLLQGRPIGERVAQYGPFVMNSPDEIQQAFRDYHRTGFGGWPWSSHGPTHPRGEARFARYADGRIERAG